MGTAEDPAEGLPEPLIGGLPTVLSSPACVCGSPELAQLPWLEGVAC
jgi:hypothetical protein